MTAADGRAVRRAPRRVGHRGGRDRRAATSPSLCGFQNSIGLDMGGTSTDISLVYRRRAAHHEGVVVEYGYPICFPSIEVLTIGAGGGSLAWIDEAGSLRNGPQSAGADPGPALLRQRRRRSRPTPTPTSCSGGSATSWSAAPMALDRAAAETGDREGRRAARAGRRRRGARDHRGRQRQHGRRRAADLDPPRLRPARLRARRLRRRRAAARRGARQGALDPDGARAAEPGHHIGARAACSWTSATTSRRCTSPQADDADARRGRGGSSRTLEAEGRERLAHEGVADDGHDASSASSTCATWASGARWRSRSTAGSTSLDGVEARFHDEHEREHNYRRDGAPVEIYRLSAARGRRHAEARARAHGRGARRRSRPGRRERPVLFDADDARRDAGLRPRRRCRRVRARRARRSSSSSTPPRSSRPACRRDGRRVAEHPHRHRSGRTAHDRSTSADTRSTRSPSRC